MMTGKLEAKFLPVFVKKTVNASNSLRVFCEIK
jgi:hypothetical protein